MHILESLCGVFCRVPQKVSKNRGLSAAAKGAQRLSGPVPRDIAIVSLRYPLSRDTFSAIAAIPQEGAIPPLGAFFYTDISVRYPILQHIARYLCDTAGKQARKHFAILSLKVSRDMKSIATGPLSAAVGASSYCHLSLRANVVTFCLLSSCLKLLDRGFLPRHKLSLQRWSPPVLSLLALLFPFGLLSSNPMHSEQPCRSRLFIVGALFLLYPCLLAQTFYRYRAKEESENKFSEALGPQWPNGVQNGVENEPKIDHLSVVLIRLCFWIPGHFRNLFDFRPEGPK